MEHGGAGQGRRAVSAVGWTARHADGRTSRTWRDDGNAACTVLRPACADSGRGRAHGARRRPDPRSPAASEALSYQDAACAVAYLLPAAEPALIDEYTKYLRPALGYAVQPETVLDIATEVV